ncbi:MAG: hypothetical protein WBG48_03450 [Pricia sp.]
MKKVFITAVFALGSLTAFAQEAEAVEEGQEAATETEAVAQDDFSEIAMEEVPEAVTTMIETNYPGATVNSAAKNEAGHYKMEVSLEDGTSGALILDEEGNAVEQ